MEKEEYTMYEIITMTPDNAGKVLLGECEKKKPNMELINMILEHSIVDVNWQDKDGMSALMRASELGHTEIIRMLLERPEIDKTLKSYNSTAWDYASLSDRQRFPELEPKPKKKVLANVVPIIIVEDSYGLTAVFPTIPSSCLSYHTFSTFDRAFSHSGGSIEWYMTTRIAKESDAKIKFLNYVKNLYWKYDGVELKEYKRWMQSFNEARMQEWVRINR